MINKNINFNNDVVILPESGQIIFSIAQSPELILPGSKKLTSWWRWLTIVGLAIGSFFPTQTFAADYSATDIVNQINLVREKNNLPSLFVNQQLTAAASAKAADMKKNNYFSHTSPTGRQSWDWISAQGYRYTSAGENLATGFVDTNKIIDQWMKSPTHRANLLQPKFTEVGVAIISIKINKQPTALVVTMFAGQRATPMIKTITTTEPTPGHMANVTPVFKNINVDDPVTTEITPPSTTENLPLVLGVSTTSIQINSTPKRQTAPIVILLSLVAETTFLGLVTWLSKRTSLMTTSFPQLI